MAAASEAMTTRPKSESESPLKRRWTERDWDVIMEAQSFIAVYADTSAPDEDTSSSAKETTTTKTKKQQQQRKKTRAGKTKKARKEPDNEGDETTATNAEDATAPNTPSSEAAFWLAQLQDDVTEDMLGSDATVRITWLNAVDGAVYEFAYDDCVDVESILCHVFVREVVPSKRVELTEASAARVQRSLRRTRGEASTDDEADSDEEQPPSDRPRQRKTKRSRMIHDDDDGGDDDGHSSRRRRSSGNGGRRIARARTPKVSKRIAAMHIPPQYATVCVEDYEDRELSGTHAFASFKGDVISANREVIRALRTRNNELLRELVETPSVRREIQTFTAQQSADVKRTAFGYAIEADDVDAVALLLKARKLGYNELATAPEISLPSHSTGQHTSAFSDYNRRAINASRGGKEGNNALLEDTNLATSTDDAYFWSCPQSSLKMLTVLYPSGQWVHDYNIPNHIAKAARVGNYKLAHKLVEALEKNGGWGFNDLHVKALSPSDEDLPNFRGVSVVKQAQQTKIRPLHFAAINPNTKYLKAMWDGMEHASVRDDKDFEVLHYAAANESTDAVRFLLENKCNLLARTKAKHTPAMRAIITRREDNAIAMLDYAAAESSELLTQVMSARGAESYQLIHFAARFGCTRVLAHLLSLGVNVNVVAAHRTTALILAAQFGQFECVKVLVNHGAKVDQGNKLKKTPLLMAVKNGHTHIAAYLINKGANVNAYDTSENSVAHYAAGYGWLSCLELLEDAGAEMWARNSWGFVPLICAMMKQRMACVDFILRKDSAQRFLDFRDREGCTMLFLQCQHSSNIAHIEFLLDKGLSPNVSNCDGVFPLEKLIHRYGERRGGGFFFMEAIRLLIDRGANVEYEEQTADDGSAISRVQPLALAVQYDLKDVFTFLLERGADPGKLGRRGSSCWEVCASMGAKGSYYLRQMLQLVDNQAKSVELSRDFFHSIASSAREEMLDVKLVEECIEKSSSNISDLLHMKTLSGITPLMLLLSQERARSAKGSASTDRFLLQKLDKAYCSMVKLFVKHMNERDAFITYKTIRRCQADSRSSEVINEDGGKEDEEEYVTVVETTALHIIIERSIRRSNAASSWQGDDLLELMFRLKGDIMKTLVDMPKHSSHQTPLLSAASRGAHSDIALLIKNGASVNVSPYRCKSEECRNAEAFPSNCVECARTATADTPFMVAVKRFDLKMMKQLIEAGASVRCYELSSSLLPLHIAMRAGKVAMTKLLLENGCRVDEKNSSGLTPLMAALRAGQSVSVVKQHDGEVKFSTRPFGRGHPRRGKKSAANDFSIAYVPPPAAPSLSPTTSGQNGFGAFPFSSAPSGFGFGSVSTSTGGFTFGSPAPSSNVFGTSNNTISFGAPVASATASFGFSPSPNSVSDFGGFGSTSTGFGNTSTGFGNTSTGFGASAQPSQLVVNSGFGSSTQTVSAADESETSSGSGFFVSSTSAPKTETVIDVVLGRDDCFRAMMVGDKFGRTPIHVIAAKRSLALLDALLGSHPNKEDCVNLRDCYGRTPLHFALNSGSTSANASFDVERALLLAGAEINLVDNFGLSALHFALAKVNMDWHHNYDETLGAELVKQQKDEGVYDTVKADAFAVHLDTTSTAPIDPVETVSNLIAAGCDPLLQDCLCRSALHLAASVGAFVCASTLLSAFTKDQRLKMLEQQDIHGVTPLGRSFLRCRETTITTLIQGGAQVSGMINVDGEERSYFGQAVQNSMSGICHMLLNAGFCRRQAVEDAISRGQLQLATNLMIGLEISNDRHLLRCGNARGETLLHCLAKHSTTFKDLAIDLAWTLVDDGLNVSSRDLQGNTALHYAAAKGNARLMDFLLHHDSAPLNSKNNKGETPLMFALKTAKSPKETSVLSLQYFLSTPGFDVNVTDNDGDDCLVAFMEHFLDECSTDLTLVSWLEAILESHHNINRSFQAGDEDIFQNEKLGSSQSAQVPALIRVSYVSDPAARIQLVKALLKHGADVTTIDSNGNSVLMHLVVRNMVPEVELVVGAVAIEKEDQVDVWAPRTISFAPTISVTTPIASVQEALRQTNRAGQTPLHLAIEPLPYGSYENTKLIATLMDAGSPVDILDCDGKTAVDYCVRQSSRFVFRFLKKYYPSTIPQTEAEVFDSAMDDVEVWNRTPDYEKDAAQYMKECEERGLIVKSQRQARVNSNCDVSRSSSVYGLVDCDGKTILGEEYDVLLTKVDVKNGRFGVNVFYRMQLVVDDVLNIYVLFTNWGRVGEEGKYQNTPFHSVDEAVVEFKKIFKSKTNNVWEDRGSFVKHMGKYNLVQRVNFQTEIDRSVTESFKDASDRTESNLAPIDTSRAFSVGLTEMLFAITDVSNLQLAAAERCNYHESLPLAKEHELRQALAMLSEIQELLKERDGVNEEITTLSGNISEAATTSLSELSDRFTELTEEISEKSSRYYEVVPRNEDIFGSAIKAFDSINQLNNEQFRLKKLLEITHTYKMILGAKLRQQTVHPIEYMYDALQIKASTLSSDSAEYSLLKNYFFAGVRPRDHERYAITNIFSVERRNESERFMNLVRSDAAFMSRHSKLLWHGTRRNNLMGILSEGLRIAPPEAPHHGYAYGKGIYFADVSGKSLNYCGRAYHIPKPGSKPVGPFGYRGEGGRHVVYMLLCDVALGNQMEVMTSCQWNEKLPKCVNSICALGKHVPDESLSIVSPMCGSKIPSGRVGRPGVDFPVPSAWATTKPQRLPEVYFNSGMTAGVMKRRRTSTTSLIMSTKETSR
ncbi:hypothetical protein PINS_up004520 [Pythium insidiosum]|nr:hypothetical protein PINS_up004520 [Pythium insidiosum]